MLYSHPHSVAALPIMVSVIKSVRRSASLEPSDYAASRQMAVVKIIHTAQFQRGNARSCPQLPPLLIETTRYDRFGRNSAMKSRPASPCQREGGEGEAFE